MAIVFKNLSAGSGGDNIKVADMQVNIDIESDMISFTFENCPSIDFYKGFRLEIFESGVLSSTFIFKGVNIVDENGTYNDLICTNVNSDYTQNLSYYVEDEVMIGGQLFYMTDTKLCDLHYYLSYLAVGENDFTAKIYYHEANETTLYYDMDC